VPHWQRQALAWSERVEKDLPSNGHWKQAGLLTLMSDKAGFRPKLIRINSEDHFLLIKGIIHQKKTVILNIYVQM
jgi:hypothetical protein